MKKIGITTFHFENNYGAVLQAYSLQNTIKKFGYCVEIIDFRSQNMLKVYEGNSFKEKIHKLLSYYWIKRINKKFIDFRKNLYSMTSKQYNSTEELDSDNLKYDVLVAGSDQIWNQTIDYQKAFYLEIKGTDKIKKISYASSFGKEKLEKGEKEEVLEYINKLKYISVREDKTKEYLETKLKRKIYHVLDPVFLTSKEEWLQISQKINCKKLKKEYILIYQMEKNKKTFEIAKKISEYLAVDVIYLDVADPKLKAILLNSFSEYKKIFNIGPEEFLTLINEAKCIITNSFHGVAFSVLFDRPFLNIKHSKRNLRMESLIRIVKIEEKILEKKDYNLSGEELYKKAIKKIKKEYLNKEIIKSLDYLKMALED